jgi:hypothetical protein
MVKRQAIVPLVTGPSTILKFDSFEWRSVERSIGQNLSPEHRQRIFDATQTYVAFRTRELNSLPLRDAFRRVERLKKSAESFCKIVDKRDDGSIAIVFAHHAIKLQFSDDYLAAQNPVAALSRVVGSFVRACKFALEDLNGHRKLQNPDGTAWGKWIVELTEIAKDFSLPTGARTDTDKTKSGSSRFVRFIRELQAQLPKEFQYAKPSVFEVALAKAINRAREKNRRDKSNATSSAKKSRQD